MPFPAQFVWGSATSAYQIEGAAFTDGKGPSIWDDFCRVPGAVWGDGHAEVACDHYHRMREDVALMKQLGIRAYRFSVSWPRVMPDGTGSVNAKGLDFYSHLVDELLAAGIAPWCTLFHWDYPTALHRRGGWLNRESVEWFGAYAKVIAEKLGDRVAHWMTLNEPQVFIKYGYGDGINAPGQKLTLHDQLLMVHHSLMAHGRSVQMIRSHAKKPATIGWAPVCVVRYPATDSKADIDAARSLMFASAAVPTARDLWNNSWYNDPLVFGHYPAELLELYAKHVPRFADGDFAVMRQPIDFIGVNIYEGQPVRAAGGKLGVEYAPRADGHPMTAFKWPVEPKSLYWGPRFMHERYKLPIVVTENGLSAMDWVHLDGKVHDPQRIDFTTRYLRELRRASEDGVDIRGYFHWSLMDNFEWAAGYRERFGLIHVDYATQVRTPKDSFHWYRSVIESNGANL